MPLFRYMDIPNVNGELVLHGACCLGFLVSYFVMAHIVPSFRAVTCQCRLQQSKECRKRDPSAVGRTLSANAESFEQSAETTAPGGRVQFR